MPVVSGCRYRSICGRLRRHQPLGLRPPRKAVVGDDVQKVRQCRRAPVERVDEKVGRRQGGVTECVRQHLPQHIDGVGALKQPPSCSLVPLLHMSHKLFSVSNERAYEPTKDRDCVVSSGRVPGRRSRPTDMAWSRSRSRVSVWPTYLVCENGPVPCFYDISVIRPIVIMVLPLPGSPLIHSSGESLCVLHRWKLASSRIHA